MTEDILREVLTGWIWMAIPVVALGTYRLWHRRFRRRYGKFSFFKVLKLGMRDQGHEPFYVRRHHVLDDASEPVFDEVWVMSGAQSNYPTRFKEMPLTSSGMVDAFIVLPEVLRSSDNHPHRKHRKDEFVFSYPAPANRIAATGILVNGLQDRSQWWFGTTAQYDGQELVLIVDFSSLPNAARIVYDVRGCLVRRDGRGEAVDEVLGVDAFGEDIFSLSYPHPKYSGQVTVNEGDAIKIEFKLDLDALERPVTT